MKVSPVTVSLGGAEYVGSFGMWSQVQRRKIQTLGL